MNFYLTDQERYWESHLKTLMRRPAMTIQRQALIEKVSTIALDVKKPLKDLPLDFFFNYNLFPPDIMRFKTQWELEDRRMKIGDTVLQQVSLPPFQPLSLKIVFGVRINSIIHEKSRAGFSYVTLKGHIEKGESTFTIEQLDDELIFKIHTYSEPGSVLSKLLGPVFSLPYQAYCTRQALKNVKRQVGGR
jgi:hypothetical protein